MSRPIIREAAIVGFGAFGRLVARELGSHVPITVVDPSCAAEDCPLGVSLGGIEDLSRCDLVILAVPVSQIAAVARSISTYLRPGALVVDVCSVKSKPIEAMLSALPAHVEIIGTHPLFGPQSAKGGVRGRKITLCPVRSSATRSMGALLRKLFGLKVIFATAEEHDREAAMVQGLTHLIAKVLVQMDPLPRRMTTASFDHIMQAVNMVRYDAASVFQAIEQENPFSKDVRERFFDLAVSLRLELDGNASPVQA